MSTQETMATVTLRKVGSNEADLIISHLRSGGSLYIGNGYNTISKPITAEHLSSFEKVGGYFIKNDGKGYRMQRGKSSVYLFAQNIFITAPSPSPR